MKKVFLLGCIVCLSLWTWGQGIDFQKGSFQEALQQAKTGNKLVFVDAFATWCGPCKKMAETVLNQPVVGDYFGEHFISIKIDIEKGEGPILKEKYGIEGIPDYLFLDGDGKLIYRLGGAMSLDKFMEGAKYAIEASHDENNVVRLAMRYEQEKNDETFLKLYLEKLKEVGSRDSYEVFEQYLKVQKNIRPSSKEMAKFLKDYKDFLVYGGEAERIIQENEKSEEWRQYVRKDVREVFQFFPRLMLVEAASSEAASSEAEVEPAEYTVYNTTGENVTELYLYVAGSEDKGDNLAADGLADGDSVVLTLPEDADKSAEYVLEFTTEGGDTQSFDTLSYEVAPISLLSVDAAAGATPISFTAPEQ